MGMSVPLAGFIRFGGVDGFVEHAVDRFGITRRDEPLRHRVWHDPRFTRAMRTHVAGEFHHLHGLHRRQFAFAAEDDVGCDQNCW